MPALFARPLPFTVIAGNQAATAPISNAGQMEVGMVWRSANLTTVYAILDMGANASYDTIAVIGSNLRATDTIQVRTGTTSTGIGAYAGAAVPAYVGIKPDAFTTKSVILVPARRTERYVRIDITSPSNPDGFVQVQRLLVGPSIQTLGIDYDAEQAIVDPSDIQSSLGYDLTNDAANRMRWKVSMSMVDVSSWRQDWLNFLANVGRRVPILFVPFVEQPTTLQTDGLFGKIKTDASGKAPGSTIRTVELTLEGLGL